MPIHRIERADRDAAIRRIERVGEKVIDVEEDGPDHLIVHTTVTDKPETRGA